MRKQHFQRTQGIPNNWFTGQRLKIALLGGYEVNQAIDLFKRLDDFSALELDIGITRETLQFFTHELFDVFGTVHLLEDSGALKSFFLNPKDNNHIGLILDFDSELNEWLKLDSDYPFMYVSPVTNEAGTHFNWSLQYSGNWNMIIEAIARHSAVDLPWAGKKILVSAGRTEEDIDPVRFITNRSSGKMGFAMARQAMLRGAEVTLVSGPSDLRTPYLVERTDVRTGEEMFNACDEFFNFCDVFIAAAAIEDLQPLRIQNEKIKKENGIVIECGTAVDVLHSLSQKKQNQYMVGFSVETENVIENSKQKLDRKSLDAIVANNPKEHGSGFRYDTNKATLILKNNTLHEFPLLTKEELGAELLEKILYDIKRNERSK